MQPSPFTQPPPPRTSADGRSWWARLLAGCIIFGMALGGLVVGLIVAHLLRPSSGEMFKAARELVPPEAELVKVFEISSETILNFGGSSYYVRAEFLDEAPDHQTVVAAVEANATARRWSLADREEAGNATTRIYRQDDLAGRVLVFHDNEVVEGNIRVDRDGNAQLRRQTIWGGTGAAGSAALGFSIVRRRRHRNQGASP